MARGGGRRPPGLCRGRGGPQPGPRGRALLAASSLLLAGLLAGSGPRGGNRGGRAAALAAGTAAWRRPSAAAAVARRAESEDWRDFRARLVQQESSGSGPPSAEDGSWAYQTDLLEQGSLLLSAPGDYWSLRRQYFGKVVMLVLEHTDRFTMAVVLNRPTGLTAANISGLIEMDFAKQIQNEILKFAGVPSASGEDWKVWFGGDCEGFELPSGEAPRHFCLHTLEHLADSSRRIIKGIFVTSFAQARAHVDKGEASKQDFMLIVGYTGWGAGQLQSELDRGGAWILGAADQGLLLGPLDVQVSLTRRLEIACATLTADGSLSPAAELEVGDGIHHWNQLYRALRPAESLDADEEAHNDDMIRRWVQAYLLPEPSESAQRSAAAENESLKPGTVLRGSATKWLLGRPGGTWPSREPGTSDPWQLPGQYFHKAVLLLVDGGSRDQPSTLALLNGPKVGELPSGQPVLFGGLNDCSSRNIRSLPGGGAVAGTFRLPAGVLQDVLCREALTVAPGSSAEGSLMKVVAASPARRWEAAGGTLESLGEVVLARQGDRQRRKWFRSILDIDIGADE